jgi:hypothetical protein
VPTSLDVASPLHSSLLAHLKRASWAAPLLRALPTLVAGSAAPPTPRASHLAPQSPLGSSGGVTGAVGSVVTSRKTTTSTMVSGEQPQRKQRAALPHASTEPNTATGVDPHDEDKYRRRESDSALGLLTLAGDKKPRTRISTARTLLLLALLAGGCVLVYVALTTTDAADVIH